MKKKEKKQAKKANEKPQAKNKASVKSNKSVAQSKATLPASKKIVATKAKAVATVAKKLVVSKSAPSKKTVVGTKKQLIKVKAKGVSKSNAKKIIPTKKAAPAKKTVATEKKTPAKTVIAKKVVISASSKNKNNKSKPATSASKVPSKSNMPNKVTAKKPLTSKKVIKKPIVSKGLKATAPIAKKVLQKSVITKKISGKPSPAVKGKSKVATSQNTLKGLVLKNTTKTTKNKVITTKGKVAKIPVLAKGKVVAKKIPVEPIKKVVSKTTNAKPTVTAKKLPSKNKSEIVPEKAPIPPAKVGKKGKKEIVESAKANLEEVPVKKSVLHKLEIKKNTPAKEGKQKNSPASPPRELWRPDYSNSSPSIDKYTFVNVNRPEPVKIESINSTGKPVKFETKKADAKKSELKSQLMNHCLEILSKSVAISKKEMDDAQESANEEKGSTEEKFDSFRESMQTARDMFARQYSEGVNSVSLLNRINPTMEQNVVILGSVVKTDLMNYFVSVSLGEIVVGKEKYIAISTQTPLCQAIFGKKKGDTFKLMNKTYTIKEVF